MRIVVADDHPLFRAGLVELLTIAGLEVVGQASTADEAVESVRTTLPDVVILDIRMPPTNTLEGLDVARSIRSEHGSDVGILLLSQYVETSHAVNLLAEGASGIGYLLKDRVLDPAELTDAVHRVGNGGSAIDPLVIENLLKRRRQRSHLEALTPRERDVLAAMAEGKSNQSIASALSISEKTVETVTSRIFTKLLLEPDPDEHRRVRAVLTYLQGTDNG